MFSDLMMFIILPYFKRCYCNTFALTFVIAHFLFTSDQMIAATADSVTQRGVTWYFAESETVGQYANGDWWVVGPVTITEITPASNPSGWIKNGTELNPTTSTGGRSQGFDSSMSEGSQGPSWNAALNKDPGYTGSNLVVTTGTVAKAISRSDRPSQRGSSRRPQLQGMEYLTVVASAPADGSFRPPPTGTDKTSYWNKENLNYTILSNHAILPGAPTLSTAENWTLEPWPSFITDNQGRWIHPIDNMPEYGRDFGRRLGNAGMVLHSDYSNTEKEKLYIHLVQIGIDTHGTVESGAIFTGFGGINCGWKWPVVLAGLALDDAEIKNSAASFSFSFDRQTWYVDQSDVGRILYTADGRPREKYIQSDVGNAEWGEQHWKQKNRDGRNWSATYRNIAFAGEFGGLLSTVWTAGGRVAWNWEASFDYFDRAYVANFRAKAGTNYPNSLSNWEAAMYDTYRSITPDPSDLRVSNISSGTPGSNNVTITFTTSQNVVANVEYGLTIDYGNIVTTSVSGITHSVQLSGLDSQTEYFYRVRASNSEGVEVVSSDYTFTTSILDVSPPVISFEVPSDGALVNGLVELFATASDNVAITNVQFYLNGILLGNVTTAPYSFVWDSRLVPDGLHTLWVRAFDPSGNNTKSTELTVEVERPDPGVPIAQWTFEDELDGVVFDTVGAIPGTLVGGVALDQGYNGKGLLLEAGGQHLEIPTIDVLGDTLTLSAWVNPAELGEDMRIISKATGTASSEQHWMLDLNAATGEFSFRVNAGSETSRLLGFDESGSGFSLNQWQHVAGTYDGSNMHLYINGYLAASMAKSGNLRTDSAPVWIGDNPLSGGRQLIGRIDDVRVYDRALNSAEIFEIYGSHEEFPSNSTLTSISEWQSMPLSPQAGSFKCTFMMTPLASEIDGVIGFSKLEAASYKDLGPIVRLAPNGLIDARDGGAYNAANVLPYSADTAYEVMMLIDIVNHRYSVTVIPPNGLEVLIASNYAFRSEQSSVNLLDHLAYFSIGGNFSISNIQITEIDPLPSAPSNLRVF